MVLLVSLGKRLHKRIFRVVRRLTILPRHSLAFLWQEHRLSLDLEIQEIIEA